MKRGGFTLVEMVVALGLFAVISAATLRMLLANQQMYNDQVQRMQVNATLREAAAILPAELRELDPADPMGGDLIAMTPFAVTYRALRNLYVVCRTPSRGQSSVTLYSDYVGDRPLDYQVDSLLLFAEGDPNTAADDRWLHADLTWVAGGECPGGTPGITAGLRGLSPAALESVSAGAPARSGPVMELLRYRDRNGIWWVGMRRLRKSGRRTQVQPLLGPLAPGGLEFSYFDVNGLVTNTPTEVASIGLTVTAPAPRTQLDPYSATALRRRRVVLRVALRNATQP